MGARGGLVGKKKGSATPPCMFNPFLAKIENDLNNSCYYNLNKQNYQKCS